MVISGQTSPVAVQPLRMTQPAPAGNRTEGSARPAETGPTSPSAGLVCPEITMAWAAYEFDIHMHRFTLKRPEVFTATQLVGGGHGSQVPPSMT